MTKFRISMMTEKQSPKLSKWPSELKQILTQIAEIEVTKPAEKPGSVVFVDGTSRVNTLNRRESYIVLVMQDGEPLPAALVDGFVDDVVIYPFRPVELAAKLVQSQWRLAWSEVLTINQDFETTLEKLRDDLKVATRLQKSKLPVRFPDVPGFKVAYRYLAGMRSGGDHFDLAEGQKSGQLSAVLSDSSSYGLSSAFLATLMKVAVKLSSEEVRSSLETVKKIHEELALTLSDKDKLSLFYGVISRKDLKLRYLNLGSSCIFLAHKGNAFEELPSGQAITRTSGLSSLKQSEVQIIPGDRILMISDGFVDAAGGPAKIAGLVNRMKDETSEDLLNELVYLVKSKATDPEDLPEQDCTAVFLETDTRALRLAG